jgi:hypothetical protein
MTFVQVGYLEVFSLCVLMWVNNLFHNINLTSSIDSKQFQSTCFEEHTLLVCIKSLFMQTLNSTQWPELWVVAHRSQSLEPNNITMSWFHFIVFFLLCFLMYSGISIKTSTPYCYDWLDSFWNTKVLWNYGCPCSQKYLMNQEKHKDSSKWTFSTYPHTSLCYLSCGWCLCRVSVNNGVFVATNWFHFAFRYMVVF